MYGKFAFGGIVAIFVAVIIISMLVVTNSKADSPPTSTTPTESLVTTKEAKVKGNEEAEKPNSNKTPSKDD